MNVLPPRKLLEKLLKYALINRIMQLHRKVGQADEFWLTIKFENTFLVKGNKSLQLFFVPSQN